MFHRWKVWKVWRVDKHAELSNSETVKRIIRLQEQASNADQPSDEAWSRWLRFLHLTNRKRSSFFHTGKQLRLVFNSNIEFKFSALSYYTHHHPSWSIIAVIFSNCSFQIKRAGLSRPIHISRVYSLRTDLKSCKYSSTFFWSLFWLAS